MILSSFLHYNKRHDARSLRKLLDENPVFYKSCLEVSDIHLGTAQKAVFQKVHDILPGLEALTDLHHVFLSVFFYVYMQE